jgi:hypothetical protein
VQGEGLVGLMHVPAQGAPQCAQQDASLLIARGAWL